MVFVDTRNDEVRIIQSNGFQKSSISFKGNGGVVDVTVINEKKYVTIKLLLTVPV